MRYEAPTTLTDACALLAAQKGQAFVLAGGTDLLARMKGGYIEPDIIIDIKRIDELRRIRETADGFWIGSAVSCAEMGEHIALKKAWPGVVEAANLIGSKQIQSRCTVVGNLCNASPAADSVPALMAADAKVVILGPNGRRTVAIADVPKGPSRTTLEKGEIIEAVTLSKRAPNSADAYLRFIPRTEMDIAVVSAGVQLSLADDGRIASARVALGAVAPTVRLVPEAARAIVGTRLEDAALEKLATACSAACAPIDDKRGTKEYRIKVAGVLARRAALIALQRAGESK